ncbi:14799_t:CDS:2, partial [Gigaspora rosea]
KTPKDLPRRKPKSLQNPKISTDHVTETQEPETTKTKPKMTAPKRRLRQDLPRRTTKTEISTNNVIQTSKA